MTAPVPAVARWTKGNAGLIAMLPKLGYLHEQWRTLDPTYGNGTWWKQWRPDELVRHSPAIDMVDFRALPHEDESFAAVAFDPPYKLNGTGSEPDVRYGVEHYVGWKGRHQLIREGIDECLRVLAPKGFLLIKCMDQVNSGEVRWQTREFAEHAEWGITMDEAFQMPGNLVQGAKLRARLVDSFLVMGGRAQPSGRTRKVKAADGTETRVPSVQQHARRNYSTLLVVQKAGSRRR